MTKRVEVVLIILIYVLVGYLSAIFFYFVCQFDFGPHPERCITTGLSKLTAYGIFIFGIPTYHFGLKSGLKMGVTFLNCCFIWLVVWMMITKIMKLNEFPVENAFLLQVLAAIPAAALYLFAYRSEWKKRKSHSF